MLGTRVVVKIFALLHTNWGGDTPLFQGMFFRGSIGDLFLWTGGPFVCGTLFYRGVASGS